MDEEEPWLTNPRILPVAPGTPIDGDKGSRGFPVKDGLGERRLNDLRGLGAGLLASCSSSCWHWVDRQGVDGAGGRQM